MQGDRGVRRRDTGCGRGHAYGWKIVTPRGVNFNYVKISRPVF